MALTRRYKKNLKGGKRRRKKKTIRKKRRNRRTRKRVKKRGGTRMRLTKMRRNLAYLGKKVKKLQRGGCTTYKCNYPTNVGEIFTGYKLNTNPILPDPQNSNSNIRSGQKGGGLLDDIGLGDALLGYYKTTNTARNIPIRYKGGKPVMPADPMHQPGLVGSGYNKTTPNVPQMYNSSSQIAATNTIS
tara:strand:- start:1673 stop:2233 length:561 start_codon:yes stop_codon:yes gene_type:complete